MIVNEVKSARRVLDILRFFADEKAPASLARISTELDFPKSSCLALLETLAAEGYAYHVDGRYYLTGRWLRDSRLVAEHDQLAARCRPALEKLHREIRETVILAKLAKTSVVYLDVIEADQVLRFSAHVGQHKPIHAAASGRALLAALPDDALALLVRSLKYERYTDATTGSAKALLASVAEGKKRGWHVNYGEYQSDTISIAAPVVFEGEAVALVLGAPMSRIKNNVARLGAALARAGAELSAQSRL
jgi:IclR family transcriptional regulator, acetate operon repressor